MKTNETTWRCGHPKTAENTQSVGKDNGTRCKTCRQEISRRSAARCRSEAASDRYTYHRLSYLPRQLEAARRKVAMLENEARRYGMTNLLQGGAA